MEKCIQNEADRMANSEDPLAVWSGSTLFAQTFLSENLGSLQYTTIQQTVKVMTKLHGYKCPSDLLVVCISDNVLFTCGSTFYQSNHRFLSGLIFFTYNCLLNSVISFRKLPKLCIRTAKFINSSLTEALLRMYEGFLIWNSAYILSIFGICGTISLEHP